MAVTVLDRMVQVVSIAIVVVAGVFVLALVPYLKGSAPQARAVPMRARPAATASQPTPPPAAGPREADSASLESEPPRETVTAIRPEPAQNAQPKAAQTAQPKPSSIALAAAITTLEGVQSAIRTEPGVLPTASAPPESGETPGKGLALAPMSVFARDYRLKSLYYPEGGMRIPTLIQHDYKTTVATLNGREVSVWTSGCGANAVSMVVSYLTGENEQTPYTLFRWAAENGLYWGSGLDHAALTKMAALYGVRGWWIKPDKDAILEALGSGRPVIAHMGRGTFTDNGHYIVLRGVAPDGTIYVNDPATLDHSRETYSLDLILAESKTDDPFMILAGPSA